MSSAHASKPRQWPTAARLCDLWIAFPIAIWHPSAKTIWREHLGVHALLFLLGVGIPALFLLFSLLGPLIYPPLTPERWPENSPYPKHLRGPASWLVGLALLCFFASFPLALMDLGNADEIAVKGFGTLFLWGMAITRYSEDRRPLPPPAPPREHKPNWSDAKPLQSEHWGEAVHS